MLSEQGGKSSCSDLLSPQKEAGKYKYSELENNPEGNT